MSKRTFKKVMANRVIKDQPKRKESTREYKEPTLEQLARFMCVLVVGPGYTPTQLKVGLSQLENDTEYRADWLRRHRDFQKAAQYIGGVVGTWGWACWRTDHPGWQMWPIPIREPLAAAQGAAKSPDAECDRAQVLDAIVDIGERIARLAERLKT